MKKAKIEINTHNTLNISNHTHTTNTHTNTRNVTHIFALGLIASLAYADSGVADSSAILSDISAKDTATGIFPVIQVESFNKFAIGSDTTSPTESYGYMLGALGLKFQVSKENSQLQVGLGGAGAGLAYDSTRADKEQKGGLGFNYIGYNPGYSGAGVATPNNTTNYYIHNAYLSYTAHHNDAAYLVKLGRFFYDDSSYIASLVEGGILRYDSNYHAGESNFYALLAGISSTALLGDGFFWDYTRAYTPKGLLNATLGYSYAFLDDSTLDISGFYYYGIGEYSAPGLNFSYTTDESKNISSATRFNAVFPIYDELYMKVPVLLGGFLNNANGKEEGFTSSILLKQDIDIHFKNSHNTYNLALAVQKNIGFSHARLGLFGSPLGVNIWDNSVYASGPSLNAISYKDALSALFFTKATHHFDLNSTSFSIGLDGRYTTTRAADEYSLKLSLDFDFTSVLTLSVLANYYTSIYKNDAIFSITPANTPQTNTAINRSYVMSKISLQF